VREKFVKEIEMALNKTAFSKRVEQLKRYEDSETNRESVSPKNASDRKVRFSSGCIFLAACAAGDKDEVLIMLNSAGADIDTANVDGLTALHQVRSHSTISNRWMVRGEICTTFASNPRFSAFFNFIWEEVELRIFTSEKGKIETK
jgi:hypothetical protein